MTTTQPGTFRTAFRGYDREQVDALLARCARALGDGARAFPELTRLVRAPRTDPRPVRAEDVRLAQFRVVLRGYPLDEVDDLLDRVADRLDHP